MSRKLENGRDYVYSLKYHLVVITIFRHKCITLEMLNKNRKIFTRLPNDQDCDILEFGGENGHVHILFETPSQMQLSKIVNTLRTVSSRLI